MSASPSPSPERPDHEPAGHPVDALVRAYLERLEASVDPGRVLDRLRRPDPARSRPRRRRLGLSIALAAGVLGLAGWWALLPSKRPIQAAELIREARVALASRVEDRHYRSAATPREEALIARPGLAKLASYRSDLWTRGDRVHVHVDGLGSAFDWGRDPTGETWVAASDRLGLSYAPGEVPDSLALAADLLSLRPEELLDEMLADFELTGRPADPIDGHAVIRVEAVARPGHVGRRLLAATLDLDRETKVLRRLVLTRGPEGRPMLDLAFTLVEARAEPDSAYTLRGHLREGAEVYGPDRPFRRRQALVRHLGPMTRVLAELRTTE